MRRRTGAELFKSRQDASPASKRPATRHDPKKPYQTLVERANIARLKKSAKEARESRWRGWQARYPNLNRDEHKLCMECSRILNRDQFHKRGAICKPCKAYTRYMKKHFNKDHRPEDAMDEISRRQSRDMKDR